MLWSPRKNSLTSLFKEVRVFKDRLFSSSNLERSRNQKKPRVRKIGCPQFWGRKWLHPFYGRLERLRSFCRRNPMPIKFLVLGGGFGVLGLVAQTLHHLCRATAVALHWCCIFRLMFSQCRTRIALHPLKCLKKALSHPFGGVSHLKLAMRIS